LMVAVAEYEAMRGRVKKEIACATERERFAEVEVEIMMNWALNIVKCWRWKAKDSTGEMCETLAKKKIIEIAQRYNE
jgi:hypothetical protein